MVSTRRLENMDSLLNRYLSFYPLERRRANAGHLLDVVDALERAIDLTVLQDVLRRH